MQKKRFFNYRVAVFIAIAISLGVLTAYCFLFEKVFGGIICVLATLIFGAVIFLPCYDEFKLRTKIIIASVMAFFFCLSCLTFSITVNNFDNATLNNQYYRVRGRVQDCSLTSEGANLVLDSVYVDGVYKGNLNYNLQVNIYGQTTVDIGDVIEFNAYVSDKHSQYENNFAVYDLLRSIKFSASIDQQNVNIVGKSLTIFESVKLFIRDTLSSGLDEDEFALAYALLTGNAEYMDHQTLSSFRYAGVAHIFAVSGLHIGFLAGAIALVLEKLKTSRGIRALIIIPILIFYAGVCGFSASSIRAVIMCSVALFAQIGGKRYDAISSLAVSAIIVLSLFPAQIFSVGFQLSFVTVLTMQLLSKPIANLFKFLPNKLAQSIGAVLSASLATLPICLKAFNYFSPIAVLINLLFIPVVSIIFILLICLTLIGGIFSIEGIVLFPMNYILKLVNLCILAFDFEKITIGGFVLGGFTLFYYLCLILPSDKLNFKKLTKSVACVISAIIVLVGSVCLTSYENNQSKVLVMGSENLCATVVECKDENTIFISDVGRVYSSGRLLGLKQKQGINKVDNVVFLNGLDIEYQEFLTKLRTVFDIGVIHYYGKKDIESELIISKSFGYICKNYQDNQRLEISSFDCVYNLDGCVADISIEDKKIAIFSQTEKSINYAQLSKNYHLMISGKNQEQLYEYFKPQNFISYLNSVRFLDGQAKGTAIFAFN